MAKITLKSKIGGFTLIPNSFILDHIKDASLEDLKLLLVLNMLDQKGLDPELSLVSEITGIKEFSIISRCDSLSSKGIINVESMDVKGNMTVNLLDTSIDLDENKKKEFIEPKESEKLIEIDEKEEEVNAEENSFKTLLDEAEIELGSPLSSQLINIFIDLIDYYSFDNEVILVLFKEAMKKDALNRNYMEAIAKNWKAEGVENKDDALDLLNKGKEKFQRTKSILKYCGIDTRNISKMHKDYIEKWAFRMNFSDDVIEYAANLTLSFLNRADFNYMDKILVQWNNAKVKTIEDAKKDKNLKKNNVKASDNKSYKGQREYSSEVDELYFRWDK